MGEFLGSLSVVSPSLSRVEESQLQNTHESNELEFAPSSSSKETRLVRSPREMRFLSDGSDNNTLPKMEIMIGRTPLGAQQSHAQENIMLNNTHDLETRETDSEAGSL
jgi:hypothetical protein